MFEQIIKQKIRFVGLGLSGTPTIEDLYDMSKEQLADMEVKQQENVDKYGKQNRFARKNNKLAMEELKLKAISYIIDTKVSEEEESVNISAKKAKREELLSLLAEKERDANRNKSVEEIKKELESL